MKETKNNMTMEDIWVNTLVDPESVGRIEPTASDGPVSFRQVEKDTILINPDIESMESRG